MLGCQTLDVERLIITFAKTIYSVRGDSVLHLGYFHIFSAPVDNNNLVEKIQIRLRIYWRNSLGRRAGELKQPEFEKCQKCLSVLSSHMVFPSCSRGVERCNAGENHRVSRHGNTDTSRTGVRETHLDFLMSFRSFFLYVVGLIMNFFRIFLRVFFIL